MNRSNSCDHCTKMSGTQLQPACIAEGDLVIIYFVSHDDLALIMRGCDTDPDNLCKKP